MGTLNHVSRGDAIDSNSYNTIVDYVNGPGFNSDGGFINTTKGTLFQNYKPYANYKKGKNQYLLEVSFPYQDSLSVNALAIRLGYDLNSTIDAFKYKDLSTFGICWLDNDNSKCKDITSADWKVPNIGTLTTDISASQFSNLYGTFFSYKLSCQSQGQDIKNKNISYLALHCPLSSQMSAYANFIKNSYVNPKLSSIGSAIWLSSDIHQFPIAGANQMLSSSEISSPSDYYSQQVIQMQLGGYTYGGGGGKETPKPFDIEGDELVRPYYMIGDVLLSANYTQPISEFTSTSCYAIGLMIEDQFTSTSVSYNAQTSGFANLSSMMAVQKDPSYSVIPLYLLDEAGEISIDFRCTPRSQRFEFLGNNI